MSVIYKAVCQLLSQTLNDSGEVIANKTCCLCYRPVDPHAVRLNDEVVYDTLYGEHSEEISEILNDLLGEEVSEVAKLYKSVCTGCASQLISCHKFVRKCKENAEQFNFAFENLSVCFHSTADNLYHFQSMYVAVNPLEIEQFYDINKQPKELAFNRFTKLMKGPRMRVNDTSNTDVPAEENETIEEQTVDNNETTNNIDNNEQTCLKSNQKERDNSTIFIKTHELVADPTVKEYRCKVCLKLFPTSGSLRMHFFSKHFKKDYPCKECSKSFGTAGLLKTHMKECHSTVECKTCHKQLLNRTSTIRRHQQTHKAKSTKVCNRCGRSYKKTTDFNKHMAQDTCVMPSRVAAEFVCDHCGKICHYRHQLVAHIRHEHLDAKGFVCSWCGRKCYNESSLKVHILKHTGEKNFICAVCGGKFVTRQSLINHMRLHTGERPYPCSHCDQSFLSASRRKEHFERHHTNATFPCDLCEATYSARRSLTKHRKRHFGNDSK